MLGKLSSYKVGDGRDRHVPVHTGTLRPKPRAWLTVHHDEVTLAQLLWEFS